MPANLAISALDPGSTNSCEGRLFAGLTSKYGLFRFP